MMRRKRPLFQEWENLHLEIIIDRLKHEFKVDAEVGEPAVAFRETITVEKESNFRYVKQTGGKGQFAHTVMRLEPNEGKGYEFIDKIKGGNIPAEYIPSVNKGIVKTLERGILGGFPVVDVKVVLLRRKLPCGGFIRHGIPDLCLHGIQGGVHESRPDPP